MRTLNFELVLPDFGLVEVECGISPAEPDVGIMGVYPDGYKVMKDGKDITNR